MDIKSLCILVCAGSSSRMGELTEAKSKVLLTLKNSWTVLHEVLSKLHASKVDDIILVCPYDLHGDFSDVIDSLNLKNIKLVFGGESRSESVNNGLKSVATLFPNTQHDVMIVHDGARPFFGVDLLKEAIQKSKENFQGYVFAVPAVNTIKVCSEDGTVIQTLKRDTLWEIQTPQIFPKEVLEKAYSQADLSSTISDDSTLVEKLPHKVSVLKSHYSNFKITTNLDIERARFQFLSSPEKGG